MIFYKTHTLIMYNMWHVIASLGWIKTWTGHISRSIKLW